MSREIDHTFGLIPPVAELFYDPIVTQSSAIFIPRKHTKMTYAKQNRLAKKRRNNKQRK
jgi:hypothetical protein